MKFSSLFVAVLVMLGSFISPCLASEQDKLDTLQKFFSGSLSLDDASGQELYINAFPDDFSSFVRIMGYKVESEAKWNESKTTFGPLYKNSYFYVESLFKTTENVDRERFTKKIIRLTAGGYHQADAVSVLKHFMLNDISKNTASYVTELSRMNIEGVKAWFNFMSDNGCCGEITELSHLISALCRKKVEICDYRPQRMENKY